ncbi:lysophospholipid acyltransferase family protein [Sphingomonas sp. ac-8]|uniref:lysophospholipid acyltransferase family protein n=1 Tax=Sphingomonas sp. ac-8 TaxID=3242977 RepID=UPI003A80CF7D
MPGPAGYVRLVTRTAAILAWLLVALALHGSWRLFRRPSPWPPRFLGGVARLAGVRSRVAGTPLRHNVLLLANHQSWLDILAIAGASGSSFVAKGELADVPLVGWLCRLNDTLFVARGDRLGVAAQVATLRAALGGRPVTIFPEGTTGDGTTLLPFKASLLAVTDPPPPGLRIQPVVLDYGPATPDVGWIGGETGVRNATRLLARRGTIPLTIRFLDPFDPAGMGRKQVAAETRQRIEAAQAGSCDQAGV